MTATLTSPTLMLAAAGARATLALVARPTSPVAHVYVGPLTRSGRFVPRTGRTVCSAHTRRLSVTSTPTAKRTCARCSARLCSRALGRAEHTPTERIRCTARYGHLTGWDLSVLAFITTDPSVLDRLGWLALLLVGYPACANDRLVSPTGKQTAPLDEHITRARTRLGVARSATNHQLNQHNRARAAHIRSQELQLAHEKRERDIAVLGFDRAVPGRRRPRTT